MSPTLGFEISRLARMRWPILSVGTIDGLGIRYGLTMNAWMRSASADGNRDRHDELDQRT